MVEATNQAGSCKWTPLAIGEDVYNWPEFIALCKRLNVEWDRKTTTGIELRVAIGEVVQVTHIYRGEDKG